MSSLTLPVLGPLVLSPFDSGARTKRKAIGARAMALAGYHGDAGFRAYGTVVTRVQARELGH
jgi:hypothetical protein